MPEQIYVGSLFRNSNVNTALDGVSVIFVSPKSPSAETEISVIRASAFFFRFRAIISDLPVIDNPDEWIMQKNSDGI